MYSATGIKAANGTVAPSEPIQLSAAAVSAGHVIAGRTEHSLPRVGVKTPDGFVEVGEPVKIQLHSDIDTIEPLTLAQVRNHLRSSYESDPSLYYGIANHGQDWGNLQAYRKIA
jgi:hypothetical protein